MRSWDALPNVLLQPAGPVSAAMLERIDITRAGTEPAEPISRFVHEETILPEQIGDYKVTLHRQYMQDWVQRHAKAVGGRSFAEVWRIREACIAALAQ